MNEQLKNALLEHYGELMHDHGRSNDYFRKGELIDRMNAINFLLGLPKVKRPALRDLLRQMEEEK